MVWFSISSPTTKLLLIFNDDFHVGRCSFGWMLVISVLKLFPYETPLEDSRRDSGNALGEMLLLVANGSRRLLYSLFYQVWESPKVRNLSLFSWCCCISIFTCCRTAFFSIYALKLPSDLFFCDFPLGLRFWMPPHVGYFPIATFHALTNSVA